MNVSLRPVVRGPFVQQFVRRFEARPRVRAALIALPLVLVLSLFTFTAYRGVDFGTTGTRPTGRSNRCARWLPAASSCRAIDLSGVCEVADPAAVAAGGGQGDHETAAHAAQCASGDGGSDGRAQLPAHRPPCLHLRLLAGYRLGLPAVLALRRKWWEALIAASCLGLSWEYNYHSR